MSQAGQGGVDLIERQIAELDKIVAQASKDLNTVAAKERLAKWKVQTVPLLAQVVGQEEAQRFWRMDPGPSFTNDLVEELGDEAETYRNALTAMARELKKKMSA